MHLRLAKIIVVCSLLLFCHCAGRMGGGGGGGNGNGGGGCGDHGCGPEGEFGGPQGQPPFFPGIQGGDNPTGNGQDQTPPEVIQVAPGTDPGSNPASTAPAKVVAEPEPKLPVKKTIIGGEFRGLFDMKENPTTWGTGTKQPLPDYSRNHPSMDDAGKSH